MCVCLDRPLTKNFKSAHLRKIVHACANCKFNFECYDHGPLTIIFNDRTSEQPKARQARLDTECECIHKRRAREHPEARLNRQRECYNERRAVEQPGARQSRLERLRGPTRLLFYHMSCIFMLFLCLSHFLDSMSECLGRIISNVFTVSVEARRTNRGTDTIN